MITSMYLDPAGFGHHVTVQQIDDDPNLFVSVRKFDTAASFKLTLEEASVLGALLLATADGEWEPRHD